MAGLWKRHDTQATAWRIDKLGSMINPLDADLRVGVGSASPSPATQSDMHQNMHRIFEHFVTQYRGYCMDSMRGAATRITQYPDIWRGRAIGLISMSRVKTHHSNRIGRSCNSESKLTCGVHLHAIDSGAFYSSGGEVGGHAHLAAAAHRVPVSWPSC